MLIGFSFLNGCHCSFLFDNQQDTGDLRSQYRADYQRQLKRLFTQPDRGKQFEMRLLTLLTEPEQVRTADLDRRIKDNRQQSDQFLAAVYQSLSDKQRRHLVEALEALIDDFTSLKSE